MHRLKDRVAIVTGAASGIGRAIAMEMARQGAEVFLADINEKLGQEAEREISAIGKVKFVRVDVTDDASIAAFKSEVEKVKPAVDIIVNAAGWDVIEPFWKNSPEYWDKVIALNLMGPIKLIRAFIEPMIEAKSGKIVNIGSDAGRVGSLGESVYAGAKGGIIAFTKSLAREVARYNINVNCVCPGPTDTPLFQSQPDKNKEALIRAIPFRRLGKPEDLAHAVVYFASEESSYVTGQVLSVSGGLTMVD